MDGHDAPKMSATFLPGRTNDDDFYMPVPVDVAAPTPQRAQELPASVHDNLARMSLDVRQIQTNNISRVVSAAATSTTGASTTALESYPDYIDLSQLPKLTHRTPNVPLSDIDKATTLESARLPVLNSSDPEIQLIWGQDSLTFVDIHSKNDVQGPPVSRGRLRQLKNDALNIINFLAEQQHPKALFMRGMWIEFGKFGQEMNKAEAFRCYKKAAERGYARAEYRMGMQFESTNESVKALQHYKTGEALGDAASCYRMGMTSLLGQLGQPKDFKRAVQLISYAADHADENAPQGAYVFGMLQCGELPQIRIPEAYLPINSFSGRQYIERAAFLGFSKAQVRMGSACELCSLDCDFDPLLSVHYNALAAIQSEPEALMALSRWFLCGSEPAFAKDEALAYKFAHLAAKQEFATAEFALGYFHEVGIVVTPNPEIAKQWYLRASAKGNREAEVRLEGISMLRTLSKKDHEDVAISKIRSAHGSMRGKRPDRMVRAAVAMPNIVDENPHIIERQTHMMVPPLNVKHSRPISATTNPALPQAGDTRPQEPLPYPVEYNVQLRGVKQTPYPQEDGYGPLQAVRISTSASASSSSAAAAAAAAAPASTHTPPPLNSTGQALYSRSQGPVTAPQGRRPSGQLSGARQATPSGPVRPPKELIDPPIPNFARAADSRSHSPRRVNGAPLNTQQLESNHVPSGPNTAASSELLSEPPPVPRSGAALRSRSPGRRTDSPQGGKVAEATASAAPALPPKKGPQTFEEMGVPISKTDHDCTIM